MEHKKTLILGASPNASRYAFQAAHDLKRHGHPIELLSIKKGEVAGQTIDNHAKFYDGIDTVTLYIGKQHQTEYYQYLVALKPKRVIFNPGTENSELVALLEKNGIECLEACTLVLLSIGNY